MFKASKVSGHNVVHCDKEKQSTPTASSYFLPLSYYSSILEAGVLMNLFLSFSPTKRLFSSVSVYWLVCLFVGVFDFFGYWCEI